MIAINFENEAGFKDSYGRTLDYILEREYKQERFAVYTNDPLEVATIWYSKPEEKMKIDEYVCIEMDARNLESSDVYDNLIELETNKRIKKLAEELMK